MDQESRDANSLLAELDRGLQSPNIGDQSDAVVRFTDLFERHPPPILFNASFLKLAEAFRCGSNFIRVQICELLERNQCHLNKIYIVDDFFRNLFTVTTSNDPIARSITLLTLGNIVTIVSHYKSIHHYISSSLETTVDCELKATITCAAAYVKHSQEFACNIYPKIVSIIDSNKSSTDIKIRALSVLDHGFYNANDAMTVRSFLINVMENTKLRKLICTCLTLSTKIAYTSLSHIMPQIELLLKTFLNDNRPVIKLNALKNLRLLAEKSPHIWESSHVDLLVSHLESTLAHSTTKSRQNSSDSKSDNEFNERCSVSILSIFCKLLTCKCNFISQQEKNRICQQCYKLALNNTNIPLCNMAFELLALMSEERTYNPTTSDMIDYATFDHNLTENTFIATQAFIDSSASISTQNTQTKTTDPKPIYKHIVKLCRLNPEQSSELLEVVFKKISSKNTPLKDLCPYLIELICAVIQHTPDFTITPENCWKLIKTKGSDMSETNLLNLCVLYFQILRLRPNQNVVEGLVDKVIPDHSLWFGYKVMRQAMRYGHYKIAGLICNELHEHVTTDTTHFYFKSLGKICAAESILLQSKDLDLNYRTALPLYEEAVSPLRASIGNTQRTNFQLQFVCLRIRNLQAHSTLRQCCKVYEALPVTYATLLNSIGAIRSGGDAGLNKSGIIQQMPKIAKDFRHLGDCYENLYVVSFNCDSCTLDYLQLLKSSCVIMADAIDAIFQYGKNLPVISKLPSTTSGQELALEYKELETTCNKLIELIRTEIVEPGIFPSLKSIEPLIVLLKTFSNEISKCSFVYPRYFFQPLQMTQIKLAITPQPSSTSGSIILTLNFNLVLKVEGSIQNQSKTNRIIREVSKVIISVTMSSAKPNDPNGINLFVQSTATPLNNYFKTEFLLPLKWAGSFIVDVDASIIDEQERTWKTGPMERLSLSVS